MKYLLDTNAVIAILKGHAGMLARLQEHLPADFGMPSIVSFELHYGAYRSQHIEQNLQRVAALRFERLEFNHEDGRHAAQLRALLAAQGQPIGPYDILIAGQALSRGLTLITRNVREFERVPQLSIENWERPD